MSCNDLRILVVRYPPGLVQPIPLTPTPLISSQTSTTCLVACDTQIMNGQNACVVVGPTIGAANPAGNAPCFMFAGDWRRAARTYGKVVLFEGDGSLLMHIQELETIKRHRLKLLICVFNDGAYGAEIHKLRADGVDDSGAIFGRTDLAAIRAHRRGFSFLDNPPGATRGLDKLRKGGAVYSSRPPLPALPLTNEGGGWSRALVSCPPASPRALFFVRWD